MKTIITMLVLLNGCCVLFGADMDQDVLSANLDVRLLLKDSRLLCRLNNPHPKEVLKVSAGPRICNQGRSYGKRSAAGEERSGR
jgi:hypothetical protein